MENIGEKISSLMKTIPKEHRKTVKQLNLIYQRIGAEKVLNLVTELSEISPQNADDYCVVHTDCLAGG